MSIIIFNFLIVYILGFYNNLINNILISISYNIYNADQPTSPNITVAEFADDKVFISIQKDSYTAFLKFLNRLGV